MMNPEKGESVEPEGKFVLLVDDDPDIRESFRLALELSGYPVVTTTATEGLARLKRGLRPSLILLDLMMPDVGGAQFLMRQREEPALSDIPVVMVSAAPSVAQIAGSLGVEWIRKPVELEELLALVDRFCTPIEPPS